MSVRKVFEDEWNDKFPDTPVPTNLSFLDDEGVSSLATALEASERTMNELQAKLSRQQFIYDFVLQRLNALIAARSDFASRRNQRGVAEDERRKTPVSKTPSAPRPGGLQVRGKASQLASVMAAKIGFGKRPAIDPEDECSVDDSSKKATPVSRFQKSNMYRASSEPSLFDSEMKFKPQPAIPPATSSRMPPGFKPVFTKDEYSKPVPSLSLVKPGSSSAAALRKSTGSELDRGVHQRLNEPASCAEMYLETDLDSIVPPMSTPPPRPPPPAETFKLDVPNGAGHMLPRRPHSHIYEEPLQFRPEITGVDVKTEPDEDDEVSSDDDELIYFNIELFKQQTLSRANALYTSAEEITSSNSSENEKSAAEKRRLRRMAHHYERIEPLLTKRLSIAPNSSYGKQMFSCYIVSSLTVHMMMCWFAFWQAVEGRLRFYHQFLWDRCGRSSFLPIWGGVRECSCPLQTFCIFYLKMCMCM